VRDIASDLVGTVSLREDDTSFGQAGNPAISADGGVVAFASSDGLIEPSEQCCGYDTRQVFARARFPSPTVAPLSLAFPPQQVGTTGPASVLTITNDGPGPVHVTTEVDPDFVVLGGCGSTLHRGFSCELYVASSPRLAGELFGLLTINLSAAGWEGQVVEVEMTGYGAPPLFSLTPATIAFDDQGIGTTSEPVVVRAANVSDESLDFTASVVPVPEPETEVAARAEDDDAEDDEATPAPVDFVVAAADGAAAECDAVAPGKTCRFLVSFNPQGLGDRTGQLVVTVGAGDVPLLQLVQLAGTTAEPVIELAPTVAREGRVVFVTGTNFLPGEAVELDWSGGPLAVSTIVPDETGTFIAPVVVLPGRAGTHTLTLTMPDVGSVEAPDVLIVPGSLQPPDFANRN